MNSKKMALLLACGASIGLLAISGSFAAESFPNDAGPSGSYAYPTAHEKDHCDEHGPGMMGGDGRRMMGRYGHRMMGDYGYGMMMESPRMKLNMVMSLDLSDEQRSKINKLSDELRHNNWATRGSIMDESAKLRDLYEADKRDPSAIGNEYQKIFDLKRKMIEATVDTENHVEELLTPEQVSKLKNMLSMRGRGHGYQMN